MLNQDCFKISNAHGILRNIKVKLFTQQLFAHKRKFNWSLLCVADLVNIKSDRSLVVVLCLRLYVLRLTSNMYSHNCEHANANIENN